MFDIILYQPEIPPNTGNIIRLCSNTGARLHLIRPLGFELDEPRLKRAGLDYREYALVIEHEDLTDCLKSLGDPRLYAFSSKASEPYDQARFHPGDALLFGPETRGLPRDFLDTLPASQKLRLPMLPDNRSLNLSNAVAVSVYEAWRQNGFTGA
jgi:tRNA (cytidine/uridine-2'-O-)-methyltransferase